jgi:hypothetical protein
VALWHTPGIGVFETRPILRPLLFNSSKQGIISLFATENLVVGSENSNSSSINSLSGSENIVPNMSITSISFSRKFRSGSLARPWLKTHLLIYQMLHRYFYLLIPDSFSKYQAYPFLHLLRHLCVIYNCIP